MKTIVFVEDHWMDQRHQDALGKFGLVRLARKFDEVSEILNGVARDPDGEVPLVVLDPGVPGVCRLDAVRQTLQLNGRAIVVGWTASSDPSYLTSMLLEGAHAAISKQQLPEVLDAALERAMQCRYTCEPGQAQWLLDFLLYLDQYRDLSRNGKGGHAWTTTEIEKAVIDETWGDRLADIAEGAPLGPDDRWFEELLTFVRGFWLKPRLRRTLIALATNSTREEAARALRQSRRTVDGYCSYLSVLLEPGRYLYGRRDDRHLRLSEWITLNHSPCLLEMHQIHDLELSTDTEP